VQSSIVVFAISSTALLTTVGFLHSDPGFVVGILAGASISTSLPFTKNKSDNGLRLMDIQVPDPSLLLLGRLAPNHGPARSGEDILEFLKAQLQIL
jgi:hypothetical protein